MKDSNSLGQLLVRVNLINEDQLKYAEDEVKYQAQLGKKVTLVQILVKAGMVKQEQLTDILGVQMQSVTKKRIGEMLLDQGFITQDQLNEALEKQKTSGGKRLGSILVDLKFIDEKKLTDILCCQFEVPFVKLDAVRLDEHGVEARSTVHEVVFLKEDERSVGKAHSCISRSGPPSFSPRGTHSASPSVSRWGSDRPLQSRSSCSDTEKRRASDPTVSDARAITSAILSSSLRKLA